jgi:hypothetical protein
VSVSSVAPGLVLHESSFWDLPEVAEGFTFETAFVWMRSGKIKRNILTRFFRCLSLQ